MDSGSDGAAPLQFETLVPSIPVEGSPRQHRVRCAGCPRILDDHYFDVSGQPACATCRDQVSRQMEVPRGWAVIARACLFGFVAAVAGAILYYAVIAITNFEIGIVAIAIGYMVGYAIRMATDGRGGRRFQVLAVVLVYWSVGLE